jgi:hypothetical protein
MKVISNTYKTILVLVVASLVFYFITTHNYFLYVGSAIGFVSILSEVAANAIHWIWMKFSKLLSYIMPNIILSIVFFFILTPSAFLQKLFKKNKTIIITNSLKSTFTNCNKVFDKTNFEKPW